jgi:hypothetical protein
MSESTAMKKTDSTPPTEGRGVALGAILGAIAGCALLFVLFGDRVTDGASALGLAPLGLAAGALIGAIVLAAIGGVSSARAAFLVGLLLPAAIFAAPAFAPVAATSGATEGAGASGGTGTGSNADVETPTAIGPATTVEGLERKLQLREAELDAARSRVDSLAETARTKTDAAALAISALGEEQRKSASLASSLEKQRAMLQGSDEAVRRTRKELDEALASLAELRSTTALEISTLKDKLATLEAPATSYETKIRTLEAAGYHACGIVMNVEKSRWGDRLSIRTSVDAARIGGEGILRAPDGTILAVIDYVIGREDALSAKVLFAKKDARITVGDVVYSRLR